MRYQGNGFRDLYERPLTPPDDSVPVCPECKNDLTSEEIDRGDDGFTGVQCNWCRGDCVECGTYTGDDWNAHARALDKSGPLCGDCVAEERLDPKAAVLLAGLP